MAKELTTIAQNYPVLANPERLARVIKSNARDGFDVGQLPRIKWGTKDNPSFMAPDPGEESGFGSCKTLEGIILHEKNTRAFFEKSYDDDPTAKPVCISNDGFSGKLHEAVGDEILDRLDERGLRPSGRCHDCPASEWGSGKNGGQACRMRKPLLILQRGKALPSILPVPGTSINVYKQFTTSLIQNTIMKEEIEVRIGLVIERSKNANMAYSQMTLQKIGNLSPAEADSIHEYKTKMLKISDDDGGEVDQQMADAGLDPRE